MFSGAGKTTLLNVLTSRNQKHLKTTGGVFLNDKPANMDELPSISAYVQQDDLFVGWLTVYEHLQFHVRGEAEKTPIFEIMYSLVSI